jgi:Mg-chelatase subunit ChlD
MMEAPAAAAEAGSADRVGAPRPPAPIQPQEQPIRAGEVDDNADYQEYRAYLERSTMPGVLPVDVSERIILTVLNNQQQPVLDARVRVFAGQTAVFEGRTYAGGRTVLFPQALSISPNYGELRVTVEKGNAVAEGTIRRGELVEQELILPDAAALPQQPKLDVLFLLDATGSMGDEISRIQQTINSIAERIDRIEPRPELRLALVAYRDRGDEYLTRVYADFTPDVPAFRQALLQVRADGGGDTPEDLNAALEVALRQLSWGDDAVRLTFLVADAPPQLGYGQEFDYTDAAREAVARGVKIYPIAASNTDPPAEYVFRQLAQQTLARFIFLTYQHGQNSGTPGDTTQMDVDPTEFTVERLDDLVVAIVEREMAEAAGVR